MFVMYIIFNIMFVQTAAYKTLSKSQTSRSLEDTKDFLNPRTFSTR